MRAESLEQAIDNFDELQPLIFLPEQQKDAPPAASPEFYIERPDNPLEELKVHLTQSRLPEKILLTGHMGSGKSTELNRLAADGEIRNHFFVVHYPVRDVLNILDFDYLDFLLSFAAKLVTAAMEAKIEFKAETLKNISKWISFAASGDDSLKPFAKNVTRQNVYGFFKRVLTVLLREVVARDKMHDAMARNITELLEVINLAVDQVRVSLRDRDLLIVIDDLEKIPDLDRAEQLFHRAGGYMVTPRCKIVYTMPIALYYSVTFRSIINIFSKAYFIRNFRVSNQFGLLEDFIAKRMSLTLIDERARKKAISNSGGVVRELVRILKDSIIKARARKLSQIFPDLVDEVIIDLRNSYSRQLHARHYKVLESVLKGEPVEDEKTLMELYHARVLLEYENGARTTAINPVVAPLLERYHPRPG
ncbi:MAG: hypothetical protein HY706_02000 [Candidatus Hydrogenedentes bacterium]|nr:hypothetical protein [Candidatus Hydrogenedentota bacterium]